MTIGIFKTRKRLLAELAEEERRRRDAEVKLARNRRACRELRDEKNRLGDDLARVEELAKKLELDLRLSRKNGFDLANKNASLHERLEEGTPRPMTGEFGEKDLMRVLGNLPEDGEEVKAFRALVLRRYKEAEIQCAQPELTDAQRAHAAGGMFWAGLAAADVSRAFRQAHGEERGRRGR